MDVIHHYDMLIDENNDPYRDPKPLQDYMDKWDGMEFINSMSLSKDKTVLEIGIGTGRLAAKVAPHCNYLCGIDISPKTIYRATENLNFLNNVQLICADFFEYSFKTSFDIIYCSLTLMHFQNKNKFFSKVSNLLNSNGRFVLSIDKNQDEYIDYGTRKIKVYPDTPADTIKNIENTAMEITNSFETENAYIFVCTKASGKLLNFELIMV